MRIVFAKQVWQLAGSGGMEGLERRRNVQRAALNLVISFQKEVSAKWIMKVKFDKQWHTFMWSRHADMWKCVPWLLACDLGRQLAHA